MQRHLTKSRRVLCGLLLVLGWGSGIERGLGDVHPLRVVSQTCQPQSCRRTMAYGSAVSIGRLQPGQEIFLTAAHCTFGTLPRIEIGIQGQWHPASVLARAENQTDLALLSVSFAGSPVNAARIAMAPVDFGTEVSLAGFPQGGAYRKRTGAAIPHRFAEYDLVINQPSLPGESGGGIFNAQGDLVGIISATAPAEAPTQTLATGVSQIRQLLNRTFPASPECRRVSPPASPSANAASEIAALQGELDQLRTRLAALEAQASKPIAHDAALLRRVERLEQLEIPVQILTPDGQILDEARYRLGQPLQFRLIPKGEGEIERRGEKSE